MNTNTDTAQAGTDAAPFHPRLDVALDKMRHNIVPELSVCVIAEAYDALQRDNDRLKAHAERLAEALRDCLINNPKHFTPAMNSALAAWEGQTRQAASVPPSGKEDGQQ